MKVIKLLVKTSFEEKCKPNEILHCVQDEENMSIRTEKVAEEIKHQLANDNVKGAWRACILDW